MLCDKAMRSFGVLIIPYESPLVFPYESLYSPMAKP